MKKKTPILPAPEILAPSKDEVAVLGKTTQLTWVNVAYNMATVIRQVGNALGGVRPEADHVFGRCMGERSDGKTFFTSVTIPWIQEEEYDWKPSARVRLDSFLLPECSCDARYDETKLCEFHLALMLEWEAEDAQDVVRVLALALPPAKEGAGVFPDTKEMHPLYPWTREAKDGRYICMICGYGKEQGKAIGNPTYRNIFIRDHSHCGFGGRYGDMKADSFLPKEEKPLLEQMKEKLLTVQDLDSGGAFDWEESNLNPTCKNCRKKIYQKNGVWWHQDLFRTCHWNGFTVAEAA